MDEDYETTKEETVLVSEDDAKINAIKSELSDLFNYLFPKIYSRQDGAYDIDMSRMKAEFFDKDSAYSYVGSFGAGVIRDIYSYEDKYIILYWYPYGTSNFKIFLYDDVVMRDNPNMEGWSEITKADVYYKLNVV